MKFYKAGKKVKHIDEMEKGKMYNVCGIVGVFTPIVSKEEPMYAFESDSENISLVIGRIALMDRIHFGMVYHIKKEFKPRAETIAKMF